MHEYRLDSILSSFYQTTLFRFGRYAFSHIRKSGIVELETKFSEQEFNDWVRNYIRTRTAKKVVEISTTTKRQIVKTIQLGRNNNLSMGQIAKNIVDKTSGHIGRSRAITIARTEVHQASQAAQFEAIQETGLHVVKEWLAVTDARTRPDHAEASGQQVNMDDYFTIGDEDNGTEDEMMFPGDPDGPANQVINCRCVCLYNTRDKPL